MKVNEYCFYDLYHKICYLERNEQTNQLFGSKMPFKLDNSATGFVVYGYIDHECGFTFEIIGLAKKNIFGLKIIQIIENNSLKLRSGNNANAEIKILNYEDYPMFHNKINNINKIYYYGEDIENTRKNRLIDKFRYNENPDDVQVLLFSKDLNPEVVWVRLKSEIDKNRFTGTLLNEPFNNYGIHKDNILTFELVKNQGDTILISML